MSAIPTWPQLQTAAALAYGANGGTFPPHSTDITARILSSEDSKRGKQYELDTAQAGELTTTLRNSDAVLDPTNTAGPFAGYITPYTPLQVTAQYPATVNLLPQQIATAGEGWSTGTIPSSFYMRSTTDATGGQIVTPGDAYQGSNVFQFANTTATNSRIGSYEGAAIAPNTTYTFQVRVRCVTAGVTAPVHVSLNFYDPTVSSGGSTVANHTSANQTLTGAATGATWTLFTITATSPANVCGASLSVTQGGAASAANSIQMDVLQLEQNSAATTWVQPGVQYPLFTGFVERFPTKWQDAGTWGTISSTVTDAFALMSQGQLSDPLSEEITADGAAWLYRLDDPSSSGQAAEALGRFPALNVVSSKYGPGTATLGNTIGYASPNGSFTAGGTSPTVASFLPGTTGGFASNNPTALSCFSLDGAGITGPRTPLTWSRMIAFRVTGSNTALFNECTLWSAWDSVPNFGGGGFVLNMENLGSTPFTSGQVALNCAGAFPGSQAIAVGATGGSGAPAGFNPTDGNWHLVVFGFNYVTSTGTATAFISVDGVAPATASVGTTWNAPAIVRDTFGGGQLGSDWWGMWGFQGQAAYAAEFPSILNATQILNLYQAWRNACAGESSQARYSRILRYAGYTGPANIGAGLTTAMGPATDLSGSDALTCLNNVVTTENGNHFVARDGTVTFQGRNHRYNVPAPSYVFGDGSGEYPYEDLQLDFDTTHLGNDVTVTQNSTGQNFFATNAASQLALFDRTMTRTVNVLNASEAQDAASWLASTYSQPLTRVSSITLNPAGNPSLWPVVMSLELGMCVQINRRPPGCPEISLLVWIEQLSWTADDKGNFKVTMQCSPASQTPQAMFSFYQANVTVANAGSNSITVTPITDAVNSPACYLAPGTQVAIHSSGSVGFENLVVASASTTNNWTTATITFTTNLTLTHPSGALLTDISAGYTGSNFNVYNANAVFDSVFFTY